VVFLKQLASIPAYTMDMPVSDFMVGATSFFANPMKAYRTLMKSKMMQDRYKRGFERDIKLALQRSTVKHMSGVRSISDYLMLTTKLGDAAAIFVGGWANYQYHLKKHQKTMPYEKAHERAIIEFERSTERSQQAASTKDLGMFQRLNSMTKLFTMFMTAPTSYYRNVSAGIRNLAMGRGSKAENIKRVVVGHVVLPMIFQFIASGFDWEDDKMLRAALVGPFNGLFIARDVIEAVATALTEGRTYFQVGVSPPLSAGQKAATAATNIHKAVKEGSDGEYALKAADQIAEVVSNLTGFPYGTIKRTAEGIKAVQEGETSRPVRRVIGFPEPKEE
jgi:hypothetical protein